jgi:hypothetical protein
MVGAKRKDTCTFVSGAGFFSMGFNPGASPFLSLFGLSADFAQSVIAGGNSLLDTGFDLRLMMLPPGKIFSC